MNLVLPGRQIVQDPWIWARKANAILAEYEMYWRDFVGLEIAASADFREFLSIDLPNFESEEIDPLVLKARALILDRCPMHPVSRICLALATMRVNPRARDRDHVREVHEAMMPESGVVEIEEFAHYWPEDPGRPIRMFNENLKMLRSEKFLNVKEIS